MLESTDGPIEHARTACPRGHHFLLSVDTLTRPPLPTPVPAGPLRIMLLCSAFNGLTQRAWVELCAAGHEVLVQRAGEDDAVRAAVTAMAPHLVICPFLRERVPAEVWTSHPTIVIHPGPKGDRGPSSLDWAIMDAEPVWGVTALQAVHEMDAGPIWASRPSRVDPHASKSTLYNGPVTETAMALIHDVVAMAADPAFRPEPLDYTRPDVRDDHGRRSAAPTAASLGPNPPSDILRRIRAADGITRRAQPTVRLAGRRSTTPTAARSIPAGPHDPAPSWRVATAPSWSAPATARSGSATCAPAPTRNARPTSSPRRRCSPSASPRSPKSPQPMIPADTARSPTTATVHWAC